MIARCRHFDRFHMLARPLLSFRQERRKFSCHLLVTRPAVVQKTLALEGVLAVSLSLLLLVHRLHRS